MNIKQTIKNRAVHPLNILTVSALLVVFCCLPVFAETGYVSDMLLLNMRSGPGDGYPVIKTLTSNSAVEKLPKTHEQFLNISEENVALIEENETLKQENLGLASELKEFQGAGTDLLKTSMLKWFLAGAGVLVVGWIIGRSMGSGRKKSRF